LYRPVDSGHHPLEGGFFGFSLIKSAADLINALFTKHVTHADRLYSGEAKNLIWSALLLNLALRSLPR
jgi:hypothetical protein